MKNWTPATSRPYFPRLDGLRGLAILAVLAEHFTYSEAIRGWGPGTIGVRTFFVLSGFLITSILLDERGAASPSAIAVRFYRNRLLRLAPAYYVAIALAALLGIAEMRTAWPIHAFYLSNIDIAAQGRWTGAGHFWTLAVEEQFYLLWFPAVILAPRRWLGAIIVACLIGAPLFRATIAFGASEFINVLLPGQVDSLAAGALIAVARRTPRLAPLDRLLCNRRALWATAACALVVSAPTKDWFDKPPFLSWVVLPTLITVAAAFAVRICVSERERTLSFLAHPALVRLGKLSYGVYVFHYFVPPFLYDFAPALTSMSSGPGKLLRSLVWLALTYGLAEISWRLLEQPFLRLKSRVARPSMGAATCKKLNCS